MMDFLPATFPNAELAVLCTTLVLMLAVLAMRTHVALMIMVTCAGFVLSTLWGSVIYQSLIGFFPSMETELGRTIVSISLLVAPSLVVGFHFRGTQSHRIIQQIVPSIFWAVFVLALTIRFLPVELQAQLIGQSHLILLSQEFLNILVLVAILVAIIEFMGERTHPHRGRPKKHKFGRH